MQTRAYSFLDIRIGDTILPLYGSTGGAPINGTSGTLAGAAPQGTLLITDEPALYQNKNTQASPTWKPFESSGGAILFPTNAGLTALSGGGKSGATQLNNGLNQASTVAADKDSVLMPAAKAGNFVVFTNNGANGAGLYAAGTDQINGGLASAMYYVPVGQTVTFWCQADGAWSTAIATSGSSYQAQPGNPTAPSSTSAFQMQGIAGAITPKKSGTVLVTISGNLIGSSTTAGDGVLLQGSYGTGTAPTNNAALTGTQIGNVLEYTNPTTVTAADINVPFSTQFVVTGLTIDTAYWLDLAAKSVNNASHVGLANLSVTAVEIG